MNETNVHVQMHFTINLGNFNMLRVELGVDDFKRESETIDDATNHVYDFVERKMIEKVEQTKSEIAAHRTVSKNG